MEVRHLGRSGPCFRDCYAQADSLDEDPCDPAACAADCTAWCLVGVGLRHQVGVKGLRALGFKGEDLGHRPEKQVMLQTARLAVLRAGEGLGMAAMSKTTVEVVAKAGSESSSRRCWRSCWRGCCRINNLIRSCCRGIGM